MQKLCAHTRAGKTFERLGDWYPRGEGGKRMVSQLLRAIEDAEGKLAEVRAALRATLCSGSTAERLELLRQKFDARDVGSKASILIKRRSFASGARS